MKQIVTDAIKATQKAETEIEIALASLNLARNVNGYGVYRERMPVLALLSEAALAIARASETVGQGAMQAWPGPADYDAEEDDNV